MKTFLIRRPRKAEAKQVAALMLALWPDEGAAAFPHDLIKLRNHVCDGPKGALFVAEGEGALQGFVAVGIREWSDSGDSSPIPHVEGWYVTKRYRRLGVGRALLKAAEDWAREKGFTEIGSDTWESNTTSIRAHHAAGFRTRERIVYFGKRLKP